MRKPLILRTRIRDTYFLVCAMLKSATSRVGLSALAVRKPHLPHDMKNLPRKLLVTSGLLLAAVSSAYAQSFNYPDFSAASLAANPLQINGAAAAPVFNGTVNVLRLTPAAGGQAGSAFSLHTIALGSNASFSTAFQFQLTAGGGIWDGTSNPAGADGIVFVLNTLSNSVGSNGQGVGYQGIGHSVGIKFDTWWDSTAAGFPQDNDPNGNFVAIYTNGSTDTALVPYYTPATSMKNGDIWSAWIDYNGLTNQIEVRLADGSSVRPVNANLTATIDLNDASILGSSPNVYAGFTSGTGGAWNNHDILNWSFNDTYQPIETPGNSVPDSTSTGGMVALGVVSLMCLASVRRRF
jgi:hypothetical protein